MGAARDVRMAGLLVVLGLLGTAAEVAAQVLVLRAVGPAARRYPPGTRVTRDADFTLRPGESVVILTRGGTRQFRGPGVFRASQPVAPVTGMAYARRSAGGAPTRGGPPAGRLPAGPLQVDVSSAGTFCTIAGRAPTLWRPDAAPAVQLTIVPQNGAPQRVNWPAGQATLAWPAALPISDGVAYQLNAGEGLSTRLTAAVIAQDPGGDIEALGAALEARDCERQIDVLIARSPDTGAP